MPSQLDFSLSPATLLRKGIREKAFKSAKKTNAATCLARGEVDKEEYAKLLMFLWHLYDDLERGFTRYSLRMVLQAFSACTASIAQDISYLLQTPESSWQSHPTHAALLASPPPALLAYTSRLQALADAEQLSLLLVHAFVRHLGDVRGGLILHDKLAGIYGSDGQGIRFLDFRASESDFAGLERWYEDQLNVIVGDSREQKALVVKEGIRAFELNCALFAALTTKSQSEPSLPLLGNPISDDDDGLSGRAVDKRRRPETNSESEDGTVSMASVLAIIVAVVFSQLIIVFGGFTGTRGYEKLQAIEWWLRSLWKSLMG